MEAEFREVIASILMCEVDSLPTDSTPLHDIEAWDSLRHVALILELEKTLDRDLTENEIKEIVTLGDVGCVLAQRDGNG